MRPRSSQKPAPISAVASLPSVGHLLREAREARDLSVETVADELMIRKFYLDALEDAQYRQLPERVYAVGFVQNYAQLMGLDANALVEQFKREAYGGRNAASSRMELTMPTPVSQSLLPNRPALFVIGGALILLVIGGIAWNARQPTGLTAGIRPPPAATPDVSIRSVASDGPAANKTANKPATEQAGIPADTGFAAPTRFDAPNAAPAATADAPAVPVAAAPAVPQGTRILIEALQASWVEIADGDGNILFTNILRLGQALPIPDKPGVTLTTGNAAGVQIVLDGQKLGPLGRTGEVKRAVLLEPTRLEPARLKSAPPAR